MEANSFLGIEGPAGLPPAVRDKLSAALNKALKEPEVTSAITNLGLSPAPGTPDEFARLLSAELKRWTEVAQKAGIKPEN